MEAALQKGEIIRWLHERSGVAHGMDPGAYQPEATGRTLQWLRWLFGRGRYFRLDVQGWEHVPPAPVMMVSNHSGGTSIPDVWGLLVAWYRHFGVRRPLHPLAHDMLLAWPRLAAWFERRGVVRANSRVGLAALRTFRHDILVMPGGDLDTWRPYRERFQVHFGDRRGYVKMALRAGVPIVPMAHAGAHETLLVLTDGRPIARALHLPELARAEIFPIHLSLPWGLAIGPWPHLPTPKRLRYRIGPAILPPADLPRGEDPPEELVRAIDAQVRTAVQGLLDDLRRGS